MSTVYGRRVVWAGSAVKHWEIRKFLSIPNYRSGETDDIVRDSHAMRRRLNITNVTEEEFLLATMATVYQTSAVDLLRVRMSLYNDALPASNYRRTSIDFEMEVRESEDINAEADRSSCIWIDSGMVLAIEDACHAVFALSPDPLGIPLSDCNVSSILWLRARVNGSSFVRYPVRLGERDLLDSAFFCLSKSLDRQLFADYLSVVSMLWVIGHEDAHKYLGHLRGFETMGVFDETGIYTELTVIASDPRSMAVRKAAELDADTCSAMRLVDGWLDREFLGMVTDWCSSEVKVFLRHGLKEADGCDGAQRVFLMRLLTLGALIPLAVYSACLTRNGIDRMAGYPSFETRALNVIYTIASRAGAVSMRDSSNVGLFSADEFQNFFYASIEDLSQAHDILATCAGRDAKAIDGRRFEISAEVVPELFLAFATLHGQSHWAAAVRQRGAVARRVGPVAEFLSERKAMLEARMDVFAEWKAEVNQPRLDKVAEDLKNADEDLVALNRYIASLPGQQ